MEFSAVSPMTWWLIAGVAFLLLEAFGLPGVGMLFAGFGGVTVGLLVGFALIAPEAYVLQFIVFFIATSIWAVLLWKPLQRFRLDKSPGYNNIVGDTAIVGAKGITKRAGEVAWSGTIMKAELASDSAADRLEPGAQVTIVEIRGVTLLVKPKA